MNSYSNFLTVVYIGYNDENGDAHKSSKFSNFKTLKPSQRTQTSLRRLQDVLERSRRLATKQDVVTTSGKRRRIYHVGFTTFDLRDVEDVQFRTS